MIRTFNLITKIELTEEQNKMLDNLLTLITGCDINHEVEAVLLSMDDVTDGVLNDAINPHIVLNTKYPSDELYEGVVFEGCAIIPEFNYLEEMTPIDAVTLWKRG